MLVVRNTVATASTDALELIANSEPPLKPNQPSHRMKVPRVAIGRFAPGIAFGAVLAGAGAEQNYRGQRCRRTCHVHNAGAGVVVVAKVRQESACMEWVGPSFPTMDNPSSPAIPDNKPIATNVAIA